MKQSIHILLLLGVLAFCPRTATAQEQRNAATIDSLLKVVLHNDQKVRHNYNQSHDPKEKEAYLRQWDRTDSINQSIVLPIVDSIINGRLEGLSDNSWRACFMVLQHADSPTQLKYLPFVTEYYRKGHILNYEYLIYVDRIHANQRKAQPFGSQSAEFTNGKRIFLPMLPKAKRDSLLQTLGIAPENVQIRNGEFTFTSTITDASLSALSAFQSQPTDTCTTQQEVSWLELEDNEKGFILMVKTSPSHPETGNIKIYANRQYRGTTDKDGLLMFKANKKENIRTLRLVSSDGKEWTHTLKPFSQEQDYIIEGI
ncbi:MAG TPA: hypothetical protein K8W02_04420 [Mediterranea massiliensis]|uniref:Uncharacterized protein n=1 Tax=Mediterranea massiliensis TaxID=1841865 RepID=A0A921LBB0_9BACT|nr:hypothetical protein [Mediterranea massiliensis]MBM6735673.1 hypothetical protein [Mediterranea massiliensis]HJF91616.1 hypothetical protein [Mediterranea massiliensis]